MPDDAPHNPYKIDGPASISFSGGRSSGYMLAHIIEAAGGTLPSDVHVLFMNTGKERDETLNFVRDVSERWSVPIHWIEYCGKDAPAPYQFVGHNSASRKGEPFDVLIAERRFLPNPKMRFCTEILKIRAAMWFMRQRYDDWSEIIGYRADEGRRVAKSRTREQSGKDGTFRHLIFPMHTAGATKRNVLDWWRIQPFDLQLMQHEGNCDLCFMKATSKVIDIIRRDPVRADWWSDHERLINARWSKRRPSIQRLAEMAAGQGVFETIVDDNLEACFCHD